MDIPFVNETIDDFMVKVIQPSIEHSVTCFIITANPEMVMAAKKDRRYEEMLLGADYVVPDGIGILLAAKLKREPLKERIPGVELMDKMLQHADEEGLSCFFLGAKEEVNQKAVEKIQAMYPNLVIVGRHHGYFELGDRSIAEKVANASPDYVFAALGFPKQEQWIAHQLNTSSKGVFMGVGGSFDIYAGQVKRAPERWIKWHLEWLYRLFQQPSRLGRLFPLVGFLWRAFWKK